MKSRFIELSQQLASSRTLWSPSAFTEKAVTWSADYPQLEAALLALDDDQVEQLASDNHSARDWLAVQLDIRSSNWLAGLNGIAEPTQAPQHPKAPALFSNGIPGRKWQQILAFSQQLPKLEGRALDWCSGKGFLAGLINQQHGIPYNCWEIDESLCKTGQQRAQKLHAELRFSVRDVLDENEPLPTGTTVITALHACGELHRSAIQRAVQAATPQIFCSPCCYHLGISGTYQPLSAVGRQHDLQLTQSEVNIAVQETVTAGQGTRRRRQKEQWWRLSFDELQRDNQKSNTYLPLPSCSKTRLSGSFADFCQWAAQQKGIKLPSDIAYDSYLQRGQQRQHWVERANLLRHAVKRAIEAWLVLDYALYLQENGYETTIVEFCDTELTPRNLLLKAQVHAANKPAL